MGLIHFGRGWWIALVVVCATGVTLEWYCRRPLLEPAVFLDFEFSNDDSSLLSLVFHGSVDADNPQFPRLVEALSSTGRRVQFVNWSPRSDTRLRAAASAEALGRELADQLFTEWFTSAPESPRRLELIAHSSGAYVLDALCQQLRARWVGASRSDRLSVRMVFIDPFQLRGLIDWRHGSREHGRCADTAIAVINTDDPAPSTNRPLERAWTLDVTDHPRRASFPDNGHYWALEFVIQEAASAVWLQPHWSSRELPRGELHRPAENYISLDKKIINY